MKTTKLILSIALIALVTTSFGQLSSIKERLFNKQNHKVEYITVDYSCNESSRIENWMHDLRSWSSNRVSNNVYKAPVVTRTLMIEQAEVVYEEELELENWMTTPFENSCTEEELSIESWMVAPFAVTEPEAMEVEEWMTTPWI